jgi:hypothetical protein
MNYRRITGVKTRGEYRTEASARRREQEQAKRRRQEKRKQEAMAGGMTEKEFAAKERERRETLRELREAEAKLRAEHLATVGGILGWEDVQLDEKVRANMPAETVARLERERERPRWRRSASRTPSLASTTRRWRRRWGPPARRTSLRPRWMTTAWATSPPSRN